MKIFLLFLMIFSSSLAIAKNDKMNHQMNVHNFDFTLIPYTWNSDELIVKEVKNYVKQRVDYPIVAQAEMQLTSYVGSEIIFTEQDIIKTEPVLNMATGGISLQFMLSESANKKLAEITQKYLGHQMAMIDQKTAKVIHLAQISYILDDGFVIDVRPDILKLYPKVEYRIVSTEALPKFKQQTLTLISYPKDEIKVDIYLHKKYKITHDDVEHIRVVKEDDNGRDLFLVIAQVKPNSYFKSSILQGYSDVAILGHQQQKWLGNIQSLATVMYYNHVEMNEFGEIYNFSKTKTLNEDSILLGQFYSQEHVDEFIKMIRKRSK